MSEPVISDEEVKRFWKDWAAAVDEHGTNGGLKQALAAFLKGRVPPEQNGIHWDERATDSARGFNACRDIVWNGRADEGPK